MHSVLVELKKYHELLVSEKDGTVVMINPIGTMKVTPGLVLGVYTTGYPIIECTVDIVIDDSKFLVSVDCDFTEGVDSLIADIERRLTPIASVKPAPTPVSPTHYRDNKIETIDVMEQVAANMLNTDWSGEDIMNMGNVLKYCLRFTDKNGMEDLKKARNYLNRIIEGEWFE